MKKAFSLIELMVAMAVLAGIMLMLAGMIGMVSKTGQAGAAQKDNFSQARAVLGLIERDLKSIILRSDLAAFVDASGQTSCAFYTSLRDGERKVALIQYKLNTEKSEPILERSDYRLGYDSILSFGNTTSLPDLPKAKSEPLVEATIGFKMQFLKGDGTLSSEYLMDYADLNAEKNVRAVIISILVIDRETYKKVVLSKATETILKALDQKPKSEETYAQHWNNLVKGDAVELRSIPKPITTRLRIFERRYSLPQSRISG